MEGYPVVFRGPVSRLQESAGREKTFHSSLGAFNPPTTVRKTFDEVKAAADLSLPACLMQDSAGGRNRVVQKGIERTEDFVFDS